MLPESACKCMKHVLPALLCSLYRPYYFLPAKGVKERAVAQNNVSHRLSVTPQLKT